MRHMTHVMLPSSRNVGLRPEMHMQTSAPFAHAGPNCQLSRLYGQYSYLSAKYHIDHLSPGPTAVSGRPPRKFVTGSPRLSADAFAGLGSLSRQRGSEGVKPSLSREPVSGFEPLACHLRRDGGLEGCTERVVVRHFYPCLVSPASRRPSRPERR